VKTTLNRRQHLAWLSSLASLPLATQAVAQSTPLKVILPVGPGSGVDVIVRSAQVALSKALNDQPVVIENITGAGGITGTAALVKAAPDGNTIAFISNNHAVNPSVYKKIPYDSLNDITPISVVGGSPFVLVVNPKVPAKNAKELATLIKSKPGEFNYASSGNGTIIHLAGEMFVDAVGADVKHIPYKGMGPMLTDIMSGQVEMGVAALVPCVPLVSCTNHACPPYPTCQPSPNKVFPMSMCLAGLQSLALQKCPLRRWLASMMQSLQPLTTLASKLPWPSKTTSLTPPVHKWPRNI
jgi:tripartite-type tricarboxylate transporter receptor subunit TctC